MVVTGSFGVLFGKITRQGHFTTPVILHNTKNILFKEIYNVVTSKSKLLIKTDKGFYSVLIPDDSALLNNRNKPIVPYNFLAVHDGEPVLLSSHDTILLNQANPAIYLDVINPVGVGQLKFKHAVAETERQQLQSNELRFSDVEPGQFLSAKVVAYDNLWKSRAQNIVIYIKPYWWQKRQWKVSFILGSIILNELKTFLIRFSPTKHIIHKFPELTPDLIPSTVEIYCRIAILVECPSSFAKKRYLILFCRK